MSKMKFAWCTDIHINFLHFHERVRFYLSLLKYSGIIISGDIGDANTTKGFLEEIHEYTKLPIYFVLGNHDFYRGTIETVRQSMSNIHADVLYLSRAPKYPILNQHTFIVGTDGWACGTAGDIENSEVVLNDSILIDDLRWKKYQGGKKLLAEHMKQLSDADNYYLKESIVDVLKHKEEWEVKKIIIVTHVPPFVKACKYLGQQTDDDYLPYFCNKRMGQMLAVVANHHPDVEFEVLCGHTHDKAEYRHMKNVLVKVGGASYGRPEIAEVII